MPEIQMRAASNHDWSFINLLCVKDLKKYLNSMWPYQPSPEQFFKLKRSKLLQGRTTIINYDGIDIGMYSLKQGVDQVLIEEISLWFDTDERDVSKAIIEDIIENKMDIASTVRCSLEHGDSLISIYEDVGFSTEYETDHRIYLRYLK